MKLYGFIDPIILGEEHNSTMLYFYKSINLYQCFKYTKFQEAKTPQ